MNSQMTRRSLLLSLPAIAVARRALAQAAPSQLKIRAFNHLLLSVSDPKRTIDYYQGLFGMPVQTRQGTTTMLRIGTGPQFMAVAPAGANGTPRIDHLCVTLEDFNVDRILKVLAEHGVTKAEGAGGGLSGGPLKVRVRVRGPEANGAKNGTPEIYVGDADGIVVQLHWMPDGTGEGKPLISSTFDKVGDSISPDGKWLVYWERQTEKNNDIWLLPLDVAEGKPKVYINTPAAEQQATISRDGRWLACQSNTSGREEVYVQSFPEPGQRFQISAEGGSSPVWSRNGRELYYRQGNAMMAVAVQ